MSKTEGEREYREGERGEEGGRVGEGSGWGSDVRRTRREDSRIIE